MKEKNLKLYYSLAEVARMFEIPESTLRYWEKEFPMIKPHKAGGGIRQYRQEDIENVRLIHHLIKEKGMTIQGARQKMKQNPTATVQTADVINRLQEIRKELVKMKQQLDYVT
jgi:DNA-binding transcriptional MerR regulator